MDGKQAHELISAGYGKFAACGGGGRGGRRGGRREEGGEEGRGGGGGGGDGLRPLRLRGSRPGGLPPSSPRLRAGLEEEPPPAVRPCCQRERHVARLAKQSNSNDE